MDIRKVKKLIELLEESGVAEIEITEGEEAVRISRYSTSMPPATQQVYAGAPTATVAVAGAAATDAPEPAESPKGQPVTAPMVGTYYESPSPDAEPFVRVGDNVQIGDTLCIIEAMKMMNQIDADTAGKVLSIEALNGEPVEFGQTLIVIG
jgi:acetyl-CoA carboxylase biotin carboxyl carrier protein